MADKLASSIVKNATVPANAQIWPPAAFVEAAPIIAAVSAGLDFSGMTNKMTHFDEGILLNTVSLLTNASVGFGTHSLSGHSLNTAELDALFTAAGAFSSGSGSIDASGVNMGVPSPGAAHEDIQFTVQCKAAAAITTGQGFGVSYSGGSEEVVTFDKTTDDLISPVIGIQSCTTAESVALAVKAFYDSGYYGGVATTSTNGTGALTVRLSNPTIMPAVVGSTQDGVTSTNVTNAGTAFTRNVGVNTFVNNTNTATVMELVDRETNTPGTLKEIVVYSP